MKICLHQDLKLYKYIGGIDKVGGGFISAIENQKKMFQHLNIPYTEKWHDDWDILQINIPWPKSLFRVLQAKKKGRKVVMWAHVTVEDLETTLKIFKIIPGMIWAFKKYLAYAYSLPDIVLCPSEYTRNILLEYNLSPQKVIVQSNGVDLEKFYKNNSAREEYRKKYNLDGLVIGTLAVVIYRKGIDTFFKLSQNFSKNNFIWFGKIFNKVFFQGLSAKIPSNVLFTGYVDNVNSALNALDIFVFPSYAENQGMAIIEAGAVGLPILIRDLPAYEGWLIHKENCLKAKNDTEFIDYLNLLLTDEVLRLKLCNKAFEMAQKEDIKILNKKLIKIYNELDIQKNT